MNCYLAKFVPDLRRNEPRNIGFIYDSIYGYYSRFLTEASFLCVLKNHKHAQRDVTQYLEVVEFWDKHVGRGTVIAGSRFYLVKTGIVTGKHRE